MIKKDVNKLKIAKELLKNTTNIYLRIFIEEYIDNFNEIQSKNNYILEELDFFGYINFDKCLEYINQSKFDITNWYLGEIPISVIYSFYNEQRKENFDLRIDDKGNIIPEYIDENYNPSEANSIQEAIQKNLWTWKL